MGLRRFTVVHVVRDGRDHCSGGNDHSVIEWSKLGFGGECKFQGFGIRCSGLGFRGSDFRLTA
jgi:hypothetical protein